MIDQIARVPPELLVHVWPQIETKMARALRTFDLYGTEDVRGYIESGRWELWATVRGQDVTAFGACEVWDAPRRRVMSIHVSGGSLEDHNAMWPVLKAYAKACGASRVISDPRRGWFRAGKLPADWKHVADTAMAEVE